MKYCLRLIVLLLLGVTGVGAQTISGSLTLCTGNSVELTGTPAGGTWHSGNPSVASIADSAIGVVSAISAGTATIFYTVSGSPVSVVVTVNTSPSPITSTGPMAVCTGNSISLSSATGGGTWSSGASSVATVSTLGSVSGVSAGIVSISYTLYGGCTVSTDVTVNGTPAAIAGPGTTCVYSSVTFTNSTPGGSWSSAMPSIVYAGSTSGVVSGLAPGFATVYYTLPTGCSVNKHIFVNPLPGVISGPANVCTGSSVTMSSSSTGGSWSVAGTGVASIGSATGIVNGLASGVETISYVLSTGCATSRAITVNATPGAITGNLPFCPGTSITLSNALDGGMWISSGISVATVSGTGSTAIVTGVAAGTATISYVTAGGCIAAEVVTVMPLPNAGLLSGPSAVCETATITLASTSSGGIWASGDLAIASAGAGGTVAGVAPGVAPISYTVSNSCGTATTTTNVTVTAMPAAITGTASFCQGASTILANSVAGGTWSSLATGTASVGSSSGVVSGLSAGTAVVIYSIAPAGCNATRVVTVNPAPGPITGAGAVCEGNVLPLGDTASAGIWTTSNPSIAVILTIGGSSGVLSALAPGVVTVTYSIGTCIATTSVTVHALPTVTITNTPNSCGGSTVLTASGPSVSYEWSPAMGLSCTACGTTIVSPAGGPVYSVTGTDINGCARTESTMVATDRIFGRVLYGGTPPVSPRATVWLISYDPADSSILSVDSTTTCLDGAEQYYEFAGKPTGRYAVMARQEVFTPGISGYVPTYAGDKVHWFNSTAITHSAGSADGNDVNMVYGNVPSGPGYIAGYIYAGGSVGDGIVAAGVPVLLKDATGSVVTYTYTNAAGIYTFSGLALGSYTIHPEVFDYYTTTSSVTLTSTSVFQLDVTFKKDTGAHKLYPFTPSSVNEVALSKGSLHIFPNPTHAILNIGGVESAGEDVSVTICDVTGRAMLTQRINNNPGTSLNVDVSALAPGGYIVTVVTAGNVYTGKAVVE